jgi:cation transport regulator
VPYKSVQDLPSDQTDQYSSAAKRRFLTTFNAVHKHTGNESKAFAVAHAAAKKHGHEEHKSKLRRMAGYDGRST